MPEVSLIYARKVDVPGPGETTPMWRLAVEVTEGEAARSLVLSAPGGLTRAELPAYLADNHDEIVAWAAEFGVAPASFAGIDAHALLQAVLEVTVEQINLVRSQVGMASITPAQARAALVQKLQAMR